MYCWLTEIMKPANQQNNAAKTSKFIVAAFLIEHDESVFVFQQCSSVLVYIQKCFLYISTHLKQF